jgi:hypothetical protein
MRRTAYSMDASAATIHVGLGITQLDVVHGHVPNSLLGPKMRGFRTFLHEPVPQPHLSQTSKSKVAANMVGYAPLQS